jgi:hypothetical protein
MTGSKQEAMDLKCLFIYEYGKMLQNKKPNKTCHLEDEGEVGRITLIWILRK